MATGIPARLSAAEGRRFGFTVGGAFLVLATVAAWRGHPLGIGIFGMLGTSLGIAALLVPARLGPVFRAWMGLAHALSRITTPILLGVLFFVVVTPIGLFMRLIGRRPLRRPAAPTTYWVPRPVRLGSDMDHQF